MFAARSGELNSVLQEWWISNIKYYNRTAFKVEGIDLECFVSHFLEKGNINLIHLDFAHKTRTGNPWRINFWIAILSWRINFWIAILAYALHRYWSWHCDSKHSSPIQSCTRACSGSQTSTWAASILSRAAGGVANQVTAWNTKEEQRYCRWNKLPEWCAWGVYGRCA